LIKAAKGKNLNLRGAAIGALGGMGPVAKEAVPTLLSAMDCKDIDDPEMALNFRRAAIWALGRMGKHAQKAVPALKEAVQDRNGIIRAEAAKALKNVQKD
jgi:HEAT repeat protein